MVKADSETGTAIGTGDNIVEQLRRRGAESHHRQADDMIRYIESPRDRLVIADAATLARPG